MNDDTLYRNLAAHLDRLPDGFAPSRTGAEIRLLQVLFTPEQAALAAALTLDREEASAIAARLGLPAAETAQQLEEMARQGLIFAAYPPGQPPLYQAAPFIVGILEFQVNNRAPALRQAYLEYWATVMERPAVKTLRQVRTIPLGESVAAPVEVLSYEQAEALIAAQTKFAVAACVCRRGATERGHGCDAPEESCLMFGEWAELYVRGGRGRAIERSEVRQILARADAHNLVLQPSNSREIAFLCCCCGCCCGVLRELKSAPKPAEAAATSFAARLDVAQCQGCLVCLDRCQMEALIEDGDVVALNSDRCIGCGLCVSTCPSGALTLQRKPAPKPVPETMQATWRIIAADQATQR